jgi:hypothetical protein
MTRFVLLATVLAGCVETRDALEGTQSLRIELRSPSPGSPTARLSETQRTIVVDVTAIDARGQPDTSYNNQVQVYVNYLGTLTPYLGGTPLATISMNAGVATNQSIMLPAVYGPTTLLFDDSGSTNPTFALGASETLWYRDPHIVDIQRPLDEMALDALSASPLEQKQVSVRESRYGANGRLVVTSVFAQGYTLSDVDCGDAAATPPCTAGIYDHMMVFSFSAPRDERGCLVHEGQAIDGFAGGVSEFNGLTEIGFPQTFVERPGDTACDMTEIDVNPARMPAPAQLDATWFTNRIMFERNEAAPIAIVNAKVCNLDSDYDTYKQWKLDPAGTGGDCKGNRNVINVISTGLIPNETITSIVGKTMPRVVGVLRPVNIGAFNVWIIYPRSMADLTLP